MKKYPRKPEQIFEHKNSDGENVAISYRLKVPNGWIFIFEIPRGIVTTFILDPKNEWILEDSEVSHKWDTKGEKN